MYTFEGEGLTSLGEGIVEEEVELSLNEGTARGRQGLPFYSLSSTHYKMQFSPFNSLRPYTYSCSLSLSFSLSHSLSSSLSLSLSLSLPPVTLPYLPHSLFRCSPILISFSSCSLVAIPYLSYYSRSLFFPHCILPFIVFSSRFY